MKRNISRSPGNRNADIYIRSFMYSVYFKIVQNMHKKPPISNTNIFNKASTFMLCVYSTLSKT